MQVEIQEDKLHEVQAEYDGPGKDHRLCVRRAGFACRSESASQPASWSRSVSDMRMLLQLEPPLREVSSR